MLTEQLKKVQREFNIAWSKENQPLIGRLNDRRNLILFLILHPIERQKQNRWHDLFWMYIRLAKKARNKDEKQFYKDKANDAALHCKKANRPGD